MLFKMLVILHTQRTLIKLARWAILAMIADFLHSALLFSICECRIEVIASILHAQTSRYSDPPQNPPVARSPVAV